MSSTCICSPEGFLFCGFSLSSLSYFRLSVVRWYEATSKSLSFDGVHIKCRPIIFFSHTSIERNYYSSKQEVNVADWRMSFISNEGKISFLASKVKKLYCCAHSVS